MNREKSLINWGETRRIFNDQLNCIIAEISDNSYCDHEAYSEIKEDYLDQTYQNVNKFQYKKYSQNFSENCKTLMGKEDILTRQWRDGNTRIQVLIILNKEESSHNAEIYVPAEDYDYAIIYGDLSTFLIVSNYGCHPFVHHPSFNFDNSDGSTFEDHSLLSLSFKDIKKFLKSKTLEYIFDQCH